MGNLGTRWFRDWGLVDAPPRGYAIFQKNAEFEHLYWGTLPLPMRYDLLVGAIESDTTPGQIKTRFDLSDAELRELFQVYEQYTQEMLHVSALQRVVAYPRSLAEIADAVALPQPICAQFINKYLLMFDDATRKRLVQQLATRNAELPPDAHFVTVTSGKKLRFRVPATIPPRSVADPVIGGRCVSDVASLLKVTPDIVIGYLVHYGVHLIEGLDPAEFSPRDTNLSKCVQGDIMRGTPHIAIAYRYGCTSGYVAYTEGRFNPTKSTRRTDLQRRVVAELVPGRTVPEIAAICNCSQVYVSRIAKAHGFSPAAWVPSKSQRYDPDVIACVVRAHAGGKTIGHAARVCGCSRTVVEQIAADRGLAWERPDLPTCILAAIANGHAASDIAKICNCSLPYVYMIAQKHQVTIAKRENETVNCIKTEIARGHTAVEIAHVCGVTEGYVRQVASVLNLSISRTTTRSLPEFVVACMSHLGECGYTPSQTAHLLNLARNTVYRYTPPEHIVPDTPRREDPLDTLTNAIALMSQGVSYVDVLSQTELTHGALICIFRAANRTFPSGYIPLTRWELAKMIPIHGRAGIAALFDISPETVALWESALSPRQPPPDPRLLAPPAEVVAATAAPSPPDHPFRVVATAIGLMLRDIPYADVLARLGLTHETLIAAMRDTGHVFPANYVPVAPGELANLIRAHQREGVAAMYNVPATTVRLWEDVLDVRTSPQPAARKSTVVGIDRIRALIQSDSP